MTLALPLSAAFMALNNYGRQIEISAGCQDCPFETPLSGENQFKNIVLCLYPTEYESFICYREHVKKDGESVEKSKKWRFCIFLLLVSY